MESESLMDRSPFTEEDLRQLAVAGIPLDEALRQIRLLTTRPAYARLLRPCTPGDGIRVLSRAEIEESLAAYERARAQSRLEKFVPASGAASRMFHALLWFLNEKKESTGAEIEEEIAKGNAFFLELGRFLRGLAEPGGFAFRAELSEVLARSGHELEALVAGRRYRPILEALLVQMDYDSLPKGLIPFHAYESEIRTPFEEHLIEAALYARNGDGVCRLHFTVSPEHEQGFRKLLAEAGPRREREFGVRYEVGFSAQKPSTDTLAVDERGSPFRAPDGRLLLRPGGHGTLLENLDALAGDIILIKNIDNTTPRQLEPDLVQWKKTLTGHLVRLQELVFRLLARLEEDDAIVDEAALFARDLLGIVPPGEPPGTSREEKRAFLVRKLARPIRVCGMVPNAGDSGGRPFWVRGRDGTAGLQIVESAEIDPDSEEQQQVRAASTHFNPVDIVSGVRDRHGNPFDLKRFVDPDAVFISSKSSGGAKLRALEHPGLWNGGMADWVTVFVEVPAETFSPVKRVTDLLGADHRAR
ncbi:MAG: DUF4301 family protein [Candidatus Eisenbacteria bacterium]